MLTIIAVIIVFESVSYFVYHGNKELMEIVRTLMKRKRKGDAETFTLRYQEHPFFGYTLNPDFKNSLGEKIHNKYGFRDTDDFSGIGRPIIYCAGDSSAYCNYIERNEDTWPSVLESNLRGIFKNEGIEVINGGCGGWTSYQSLLRLCAWIDVLKPKLVIIYHGKTDFAPFINGSLFEPEVFPDYGNVMSSLKFDAASRALLLCARFSYTGKVLYGRYMSSRYYDYLERVYNLKKPKMLKEIKKGLERIGPREWEFIISRYRSFAALCEYRNIPVLFVTQKDLSKLYKPYLAQLNKGIRLLECQAKKCFVYDFDNENEFGDDLLCDSVHFTNDGARLFSKKLEEYILHNILLFNEKGIQSYAGK